MKKIIFIFSIAVFFAAGCDNKTHSGAKVSIKEETPQNPVSEIKETNVMNNNTTEENHFKPYAFKKKIDPEKFFKNKNDHSQYEFTDTDGMEVKRWEDSEFPSGKVKSYIEDRNYPDSQYYFQSEFDPDGNITMSSTTFSRWDRILVGITKYYDASGKIIKEKNNDELYKFSVEDLGKKMKAEYNIDIFNTNTKIPIRVLKNYEKPVYHVIVGAGPGRYGFLNYTLYVVDPDTGKTLSVTAVSRHPLPTE